MNKESFPEKETTITPVGGVVLYNKLKEGQIVELIVMGKLKEGANLEDIPKALFTPSKDSDNAHNGFEIKGNVLKKIDITLCSIRVRDK